MSAHLNSNYFYEKKYQHLTITEKKYPEKLNIGLDLSNSKQQLTYKNIQRTFLKIIKEKGIEYFKFAKVWIIPEDNGSLEKHLLQLQTSSVTKEKYEIVKKQSKEEKDTNIVFQAFCILEDNKITYKIRSYKIFPKKWMITYLLDWAHKSTKSHLKTREMGEYLSNKLNVFSLKMYEECERFCKDWESCQMFKKIKKRKRIVKYIRSNSWFKRYQADTVELDNRIIHNHTYPNLLTIVDHFSKYGFAYAISDKKQKQLGITWLKLL